MKNELILVKVDDSNNEKEKKKKRVCFTNISPIRSKKQENWNYKRSEK